MQGEDGVRKEKEMSKFWWCKKFNPDNGICSVSNQMCICVTADVAKANICEYFEDVVMVNKRRIRRDV